MEAAQVSHSKEVDHDKIASSLIRAYGKCKDVSSAKQVYESRARSNIVLATAMMSVFGENGNVMAAKQIFDKIDAACKDHVVYTAMLGIYEENACYEEAIAMYHEIGDTKTSVGHLFHVLALSACAKADRFEVGRSIHEDLKQGCNEHLRHFLVQTQLIHLYGKTGDLGVAEQLFEREIGDAVKQTETCVHNAMIGAYARGGKAREALQLFETMRVKFGLFGDDVTYVTLLGACSHAGLVDEAEVLFEECRHAGRINNKTFTAMIDCYARKGKFKRAARCIRKYERETDPESHFPEPWMALFAATRHEATDLARQIYRILRHKFKIDMEQHHRFDLQPQED